MTPIQPRSDPQRLRRLIGLHAVPAPRIVDVTYGHGVFWRGLPYQPLRLDVRELPGVDQVADWRELPRLFSPRSFDVVVWDPIHVTDVGPSSRLFQRYGAESHQLKGENINQLYGPFLASALAVLQPVTGICIVKLADMVHNGRQQLAFVDFVNASRAAGLTVCDYDVGYRTNPIGSPLWINQWHVRKSWAYWIVVRNGAACHGPGRARLHVCPGCKLPFRPSRRDARSCSARCRQRLHRGVA